MRSIRRDILVTLLIKTLLLTSLWWLCFKGNEKHPVKGGDWLFASRLAKQDKTDVHHGLNNKEKERSL